MHGRGLVVAGLAAAVLSGIMEPVSTQAASVPRQHVRGHLRVDGSSDLRGKVVARSGLGVSAGLVTDSLNATGPVVLGGTLTVSGAVTTNGLNAGSGTVATTGALQGGTLVMGGDATIGGGLAVSKRVGANGVDVGAGGLHVAGAVSGNNATFDTLTVSPGGSVNFNNASITGVSGLTLSGNATLSSLQITTTGQGGPGGTQALTVTQNGRSASISVDASSALVVGGPGLVTPALTVSNNATVQGKLFTPQIENNMRLTLNSPEVATGRDLIISTGGTLKLSASASDASHISGNHDTRGTCAVNATTGGINTCSISFLKAYANTPVVVVTPNSGAPGLVTGYSVQANTSGFSILFTVSQAANVTFNYLVQQ